MQVLLTCVNVCHAFHTSLDWAVSRQYALDILGSTNSVTGWPACTLARVHLFVRVVRVYGDRWSQLCLLIIWLRVLGKYVLCGFIRSPTG